MISGEKWMIWALLILYIVPAFIFLRSIKKTKSHFKKLSAKSEDESPSDKPKAFKAFIAFFSVSAIIFIIFILFRIQFVSSPEPIKLQDIFKYGWVLTLFILTLNIAGILYGLSELNKDTKKAWPIFCILGNLAVFFISSLFTVLMFFME